MQRPLETKSTPAWWKQSDLYVLAPILVGCYLLYSAVLGGFSTGLLFVGMFGGLVIGTALCLTIYLAPWLIAQRRQHRGATRIALLNVTLGWSVLGWFAALIWALGNPARRDAYTAKCWSYSCAAPTSKNIMNVAHTFAPVRASDLDG